MKWTIPVSENEMEEWRWILARQGEKYLLPYHEIHTTDGLHGICLARKKDELEEYMKGIRQTHPHVNLISVEITPPHTVKAYIPHNSFGIFR